MLNNLSIVIPTYNEELNILSLVEKIDAALRPTGIMYELLFVDDHSTDNTRGVINELISRYPIILHMKKAKSGKAYSLLEGFSYAIHPIVGFIDADLQYPPEVIPQMLQKITDGSDIVIANRHTSNRSFSRKFISKMHNIFFARLLHGLNIDVQSGLKIFRKEILQRIILHPRPWSFDLEFLLKARNAGYTYDSVDIQFAERQFGKSKINIFKSSYEIGLEAIKMKIKPLGVVPFLPEHVSKLGKGFHYKGQQFVHHGDLENENTAFFRLSGFQRVFLSGIVIVYLLLLLNNWHLTLLVSFAILTICYFADLLFNLFLIFQSYRKHPEIAVLPHEIHNFSDDNWPMYSIFCPLYKEWRVIPQFVSAMSQLDYPQDKLQVMLILEQDDRESIENIKQYNLPPSFEIIIVPHSLPKTKPKACNYALQYAKGELCVIYDAEDVPDSDQLKKTVLAFRKSPQNTICIQAKLNFYNPHHNILTRVFTAEYSLWFDLFLTGLQSINAPIPLGGTSNHFRTADIRKLKGWDAFNVTEDCDLGMRLVKQGYSTAILDSTTHEEANSSYSNWFGQRSRWIKGYMQTYLVHMRNPGEFMSDWKNPNLFLFQLIVGGKILSMLINPFLWIITISYFIFRATLGPLIESLIPPYVLYIAVFSAVIGNFLYFYYYLVGCLKRQYFDIVKYGFLIPFYWLMMSVATWMAFYQIIVKPHHWFKTQHGLHMDNNAQANQAKDQMNRNGLDNNVRSANFAT